MLKNAVALSKHYIKEFVTHGDIVIDATCGNGNDTLFLAKLVGDKGKVFAFDIQEMAIFNTKNLLRDMVSNTRVIQDGHENLDGYVHESIKLCLFNLGYLPKGDHNIQTKPENTIIAIEKALKLLSKNGLILIVIYHGGDSGYYERDAIIAYLSKLDYKKYNVITHNYINKPNDPPILCVISWNEREGNE